MQDTTNPPAQVPPPAANTPPAQPCQNLKSGINALQHEKKKKTGNVGNREKRTYNLWYNLIAQLTDSDDEEGESEIEPDEEYGGEFWEDKVASEEETEEDSDEDNGEESEGEEENEDCLFKNRHLWVPVYFQYELWAGMRSTQRSDSMHAFYDGFLHTNTSLIQSKAILCCHMLSTFAYFEVNEVPTCYVSSHWSKNVRRKHIYI
ncbi:hypothetical protein PIB30_012628 [Stylosanthes scabra]|uniref:Protein FAR1-RELATED SEQUENCE n=1 Tax=Stylosanthes scabra TaxID=79078 RepID=A0ABU6Y2Z9_9FABA|nr:hypothetical protein [Stylosanthes scabra]